MSCLRREQGSADLLRGRTGLVVGERLWLFLLPGRTDLVAGERFRLFSLPGMTGLVAGERLWLFLLADLACLVVGERLWQFSLPGSLFIDSSILRISMTMSLSMVSVPLSGVTM